MATLYGAESEFLPCTQELLIYLLQRQLQIGIFFQKYVFQHRDSFRQHPSGCWQDSDPAQFKETHKTKKLIHHSLVFTQKSPINVVKYRRGRGTSSWVCEKTIISQLTRVSAAALSVRAKRWNHVRCQQQGHGGHCGIHTWSVFSREDEVMSLAGKYC